MTTSLRESASRVIAAFKAHGAAKQTIDDLVTRRECEAAMLALEAALSTPPADDVLPCDVIVAPATRILAGCKVSTLMRCIETRRAAMIAATEGSNG